MAKQLQSDAEQWDEYWVNRGAAISANVKIAPPPPSWREIYAASPAAFKRMQIELAKGPYALTLNGMPLPPNAEAKRKLVNNE